MSLLTRTAKGSKLTIPEMDNNLTYLESVGTIKVSTVSDLTGYTGSINQVIVTDSIQGGIFYATSATLTDDYGITFPKSAGGHWVRQYNKSSGINPAWFSSLSVCISSIATANSSIVINEALTLTANLTIPSNISVKINKGGSINVGSFTLTINGSFSAGRYTVFSGTGLITFGTGAVDNQYPEWDGAYNDGTHSTETTAAFAKQVRRGNPIELGIGTYLVTNISSYLNQPLIIKGQTQRGQSVIQTTADVNVGISIASVYPVYESVLKDFSLVGTSSNLGGIQLGNATDQSVVVYATIENLKIINFTATNAFGISLNSVQEVDINNCYIQNNYNGIYRPDLGYVTSTKISGKDSYCGHNLNRGLAIEGKLFDLHVKDVIFEGNGKEGIYYNYGNDTSIILINDCYLEANCKGGSGSGLAAITVIGGTTSATKATPLIQRCQFHGNWGDIVKETLYLDNVIGGEVSNCIGLGVQVTTTSTVGCHFRDNATTSSYFVNWKNFYSNLVGNITADDIDIDGKRFFLGNRRFVTPLTDKISYASGTTFASGDGDTLVTKNYTDTADATKLNGVGNGVTGYFSKWTNSSTLNSSTQLFENISTGYIGIGTVTPATQLNVHGIVRIDGLGIESYDSNGYGGGRIYSTYGYVDGEIYLLAGGSSAATVLSPNGGMTIGGQTFNSPANGLVVKGNVGIGVTTSPTNPLEVVGTILGTTLKITGSTIFGSSSTPDASALLDLTSTTKGVLLPRMTKTQRDAITSPATGLALYQTDNTPGLRVYNGTNWMKYTETAD